MKPSPEYSYNFCIIKTAAWWISSALERSVNRWQNQQACLYRVSTYKEKFQEWVKDFPASLKGEIKTHLTSYKGINKMQTNRANIEPGRHTSKNILNRSTKFKWIFNGLK